MGELLFFLIFVVVLILIFIFLAFSIFWGAIVLLISAVVAFFTSPFNSEDDIKIIKPENNAPIICVDPDSKKINKLEMGEYIFEYNKSSGDKYVVSNKDKRYKMENCFYTKKDKYL